MSDRNVPGDQRSAPIARPLIRVPGCLKCERDPAIACTAGTGRKEGSSEYWGGGKRRQDPGSRTPVNSAHRQDACAPGSDAETRAGFFERERERAQMLCLIRHGNDGVAVLFGHLRNLFDLARDLVTGCRLLADRFRNAADAR